MRSESHRRALLATARIAAGAILLGGCPSPAPPDTLAAPEAVAPSDQDVATCTTVVEATDFAKRVGDDVKACCATLAEDADSRGDMTFVKRSECCSELNWQGSMACTPWGPPTPPEMTA